MNNANKKKYDLLGVPFGTASNQLRKAIMFQLIQKTNEDICYRCGKKIENIDDFSIDHKNSWLKAENPKEAFFDLKNITFSHLKCNTLASDRTTSRNRGENHWEAKLTSENVKEIRKELEEGIPQVVIAKKYGIAPPTVRDIKTKRNWGYIK